MKMTEDKELGDIYEKSVEDFKKQMDICKLEFGEKHQWKREYPEESDVNAIKNLIADYMEGSGNFCKGKVPSLYKDIEKLDAIFDEMVEDHKKEIESEYLARVFMKLGKTDKLSEKMSILKFLYFDKPLKEIKAKLSGKKFSLYDHMPYKEKNLFYPRS